jgi:PKD-like domain/Secretion system C-terminal sorting domain
MKKRLLTLGLVTGLGLMLGAQTSTFNFTGGIQTFTVPCGVTSVFVQTWGAQGGSGALGGNNVAGGTGGLGGYAEGFLAVTPGDVLNIFVGGQGTTPAAGFNGGGNGGSQNAGGGGGASDIRVGGTAEANRVITAGGGGGGGRGGCHEGSASGGTGGNGGSGGGGVGANGNDSPQSSGVAGGGKGGNFGNVQGAFGAAGVGCSGFLGAPGGTATTGTGASGGAGQTCCCSSSNSVVGGGGGGGGQLGGGGGGGGSAGTTGCAGNSKGAGGGGGGGSSYVGGVTSGVVNNGIWLGDGQVTISWTSPVPPSHVITGLPAICQGISTNYSINSDPFSTIYTWTVPNGLIFNTGQNTTSINVTGGLPGTYTIYVFGVNSPCSLTGPTDSIVVTVNSLPTVTASSTDVCLGASNILTASGAISYDWQPGNLTGSSVSVTNSSSTSYTVTGTDANGCINTATVLSVVNALPIVTPNQSSVIVCSGDSVILFGQGASTYVWSGGITDNVPFTPNASGSYTVTGTDSSGCSDTASAIVTVNPLPVISATGTLTVCSGSPTVLTASGASSYVWQPGNLTGSTVTVTPTTTTTYTVTGTDANACSNLTTITITVNPLPQVSLSGLGIHCVDDGSFTLTNGQPTGGTYSGPGVTGGVFTPLSAGIGNHVITYTFTDANGCTNSATSSIVVNACVGIYEGTAFASVSYLPNPVAELLTVRWDNTQLHVNVIEVRDITGRLVMTESLNNGNSAELNVSALPSGSYSLTLFSDKGDKAVYTFVRQ